MNKFSKIFLITLVAIIYLNEAGASLQHSSISFENLRDDTPLLKVIALAILERPQDIQAMKEGMRNKHGQRSYELWRDHFDINDTWGPAWGKLSNQVQTELLQIFRTKDNAKMIMKRDTFILVSNDTIADAQTLAEAIVQNGNFVLDISQGNQRNPYTLTIKYNFSQAKGKLYTKHSSSAPTEQDLTHMYLVLNVSDIIKKILDSKKDTIEEKKSDWNRHMDGYIATLSPTT